MKTLSILAAGVITSLAFLGSAQAGELDWPPADTSTSTVTRAQVQAELHAARALGQLASGEQEYPITAYADASAVSRDQVQAALLAARQAGQTAAGELDYPPAAG